MEQPRVMYTTDRVAQVDWITQLADDLHGVWQGCPEGYDSADTYAEDVVAEWQRQEADSGYDQAPEWFDARDRNLLVRLVAARWDQIEEA
jgi:hypothetical protein